MDFLWDSHNYEEEKEEGERFKIYKFLNFKFTN